VKIVAIIQARMGSTRLPGKVLMDLAGQPMLARVVDRLRRAQTLDEVVIAASLEPADKAIADLCEARGWACCRGSQDDVLDRYRQAALQHGADVVVRITSDCPLIEPEIVDRVLGEFCGRYPNVDYVSNVLPPRTFPRGLDVEAMSIAALERAWSEAQDAASREHVTSHIYNHPEIFKLAGVSNDADYSHMRWCVDTAEDWEFVSRVYQHFGHDRFSWRDVLAVLKQHPDWQQINSQVRQKEL